jgi:hypothetical protein
VIGAHSAKGLHVDTGSSELIHISLDHEERIIQLRAKIMTSAERAVGKQHAAVMRLGSLVLDVEATENTGPGGVTYDGPSMSRGSEPAS